MGLLSRYIDKRLTNFQQELMKTHIEEVQTMVDQVRGYRHDYHNHLQVMKAHLQTSDIEALRDYVGTLEKDLKHIQTYMKTGNSMADAILNSKMSLAKAKGIQVNVSANIPFELKISSVDLCVILGNLFDNAIEGVMNLPEELRIIRVYLDMKQTQLYISFTNLTASKKQVKIQGRFLSTKGNQRGFGLIRIDDIVKRSGGYLSRNSEDGAFTTEILLPQQ